MLAKKDIIFFSQHAYTIKVFLLLHHPWHDNPCISGSRRKEEEGGERTKRSNTHSTTTHGKRKRDHRSRCDGFTSSGNMVPHCMAGARCINFFCVCADMPNLCACCTRDAKCYEMCFLTHSGRKDRSVYADLLHTSKWSASWRIQGSVSERMHWYSWILSQWKTRRKMDDMA